MTDPKRDPRLSTAVAIADALDVSLDYLAGRTDNPMGICDERLDGVTLDSDSVTLIRDYMGLDPDGRRSVRDMLDFQLSKSGAGKGDPVSAREVA